MPVELKVPEVGESISEVFIGTWLKNEGDSVEQDEALVEVETDKATLEIPATTSGKLSKILKAQGDSAQVGEVIAHISAADEADAPAESEGEAEAKESGVKKEETSKKEEEPSAVSGQPSAKGDEAKEEEKRKKEEKAEAETEEAEAESGDEAPRIMPAAQRLLDEHGLQAADVKATGPGGRLLKEDVQRQVAESEVGGQGSEEQVKAEPEPEKEKERSKKEEAPAGAGNREEEAVPMSPLRRRIAERLVGAQQNAALLTTFNEIDMSEVIALRKQYQDSFVKRYDIKLGFMSFFVKATIDALKGIPQLNAYIDGNNIIYHNYYDIGIAVSAKKGLIVPVIRNAEHLSFAETEEAISDFGKRALANKLSPDELQGGTFTISNGGVFGSLMSTPIVNPPQSGVLGMHTIQERPVAIDGKVEIRPMMYVALTYDHRVVDGREAVTFLKRIKDAVEQPTRILLEV